MAKKPPDPQMSIAGVERETGLGKDTLRVWERRYGFPRPGRDANGERVYPESQVAQLRLVKRLLDRGMRPGRLLARDAAARAALAEQAPGAPAPPRSALHDLALFLLKTHQTGELRRELVQVLMRDGVKRFVLETAAPLTVHVGEAWARGEVQVFEEHLLTEVLQSVLRQAIAQLGVPSTPPVVLLTTLPDERHGLGLLMVEAIATLEGAQCVSLGTQSPVRDIVAAAIAHKADVVALSVSLNAVSAEVQESVNLLRGLLAPRVALWCGGAGAARLKRLGKGVERIAELDDVGAALEAWRAHHGGRARS
ncbi:MAG: MerR family transcriptional regulator [Burkholderiales bacterium]|nr:MerR family transcriptional regulator [Burkholderiales bacterium]